jgi:hypothetical protein
MRASGWFLAAAVMIAGGSAWRSAFAQREGAADRPLMEETYSNIQVLNGIPASEKDGIMAFMAASLGVGCTHCHINPWSSDERPAKAVARRMIAMTRRLNDEHFAGRQVVNCYSCHQGQLQPRQSLWPMLSPPAATPATPAPALPSASQIVERYERAIGGRPALARLRSRAAEGTQITTNRMTPPQSQPFELIQAAPDRMLLTVQGPRGATTTGYDGTRGWTRTARGVSEISGADLADTRRDADLLRYLNLDRTYASLTVTGRETVAGHDCWVVDAAARDGLRETLYFDTASGLLVRRMIAYRTAFGIIPEVTDFSDYRRVGGARLPFTIAWARPPFTSTQRFRHIRINVAVEPARFAPPPS